MDPLCLILSLPSASTRLILLQLKISFQKPEVPRLVRWPFRTTESERAIGTKKQLISGALHHVSSASTASTRQDQTDITVVGMVSFEIVSQL